MNDGVYWIVTSERKILSTPHIVRQMAVFWIASAFVVLHIACNPTTFVHSNPGGQNVIKRQCIAPSCAGASPRRTCTREFRCCGLGFPEASCGKEGGRHSMHGMAAARTSPHLSGTSSSSAGMRSTSRRSGRQAIGPNPARPRTATPGIQACTGSGMIYKE